MKGREHLTFGIASALTATMIANNVDIPFMQEALKYPVVFIGTSAIGSLLPDIDTPESTMGKIMYPIAVIINKIFGHRTVTHDILFIAFLTALSLSIGNIFFIGIMFGVVGHIFLDATTIQGVKFGYIFNTKTKNNFHVLPRFARVRSGSIWSVILTWIIIISVNAYLFI